MVASLFSLALSAMSVAPSVDCTRPIGVFDSGIGGLSILRALRLALPAEDFVYFADSAHTPYGEKTEDAVQQRCHAITDLLLAQHRIKALVIACNTATAVAAHSLRQRYPQLPIIGVEPAIKPATSQSQTGHIAVLATPRTIAGAKLASLMAQYGSGKHITALPCPGLAAAIEAWPSAGNDSAVQQRIQTLLAQLPAIGTDPGEIDTVVLGCTHYPLAWSIFRAQLGSKIALLETGPAVARQTASALRKNQCLHPESQRQGELMLASSAPLSQLDLALHFWP